MFWLKLACVYVITTLVDLLPLDPFTGIVQTKDCYELLVVCEFLYPNAPERRHQCIQDCVVSEYSANPYLYQILQSRRFRRQIQDSDESIDSSAASSAEDLQEESTLKPPDKNCPQNISEQDLIHCRECDNDEECNETNQTQPFCCTFEVLSNTYKCCMPRFLQQRALPFDSAYHAQAQTTNTPRRRKHTTPPPTTTSTSTTTTTTTTASPTFASLTTNTPRRPRRTRYPPTSSNTPYTSYTTNTPRRPRRTRYPPTSSNTPYTSYTTNTPRRPRRTRPPTIKPLPLPSPDCPPEKYFENQMCVHCTNTGTCSHNRICCLANSTTMCCHKPASISTLPPPTPPPPTAPPPTPPPTAPPTAPPTPNPPPNGCPLENYFLNRKCIKCTNTKPCTHNRICCPSNSNTMCCYHPASTSSSMPSGQKTTEPAPPPPTNGCPAENYFLNRKCIACSNANPCHHNRICCPANGKTCCYKPPHTSSSSPVFTKPAPTGCPSGNDVWYTKCVTCSYFVPCKDSRPCCPSKDKTCCYMPSSTTNTPLYPATKHPPSYLTPSPPPPPPIPHRTPAPPPPPPIPIPAECPDQRDVSLPTCAKCNTNQDCSTSQRCCPTKDGMCCLTSTLPPSPPETTPPPATPAPTPPPVTEPPPTPPPKPKPTPPPKPTPQPGCPIEFPSALISNSRMCVKCSHNGQCSTSQRCCVGPQRSCCLTMKYVVG